MAAHYPNTPMPAETIEKYSALLKGAAPSSKAPPKPVVNERRPRSQQAKPSKGVPRPGEGSGEVDASRGPHPTTTGGSLLSHTTDRCIRPSTISSSNAESSNSPGPGSSTPAVGATPLSDAEIDPRELIIRPNGKVRQAGADDWQEKYTKGYKKRAEESLFIFLKGVLGRFFLTEHFHRSMCNWLQQRIPFRKLGLMPREHAKTTIVSGGLPCHILIQPAETNIYFPGIEGSECRILMAGETETMAKKNLRVVQSTFEENRLFRALWEDRVWENTRQSKQWSSEAMIIPRQNEWPDPTIRAVGVGGAITGARPNVMIKDDLVSFKAANSEVVMDEAIEWHKASRALLDKYEVESGLQSLEFLVGTRWAVFDLYSYIIDNDPSVEVNDPSYHKIISDGKILWPEKYTQADIEQLRLEHGAMFYLLYLNSAADPELTDFDMELVRSFHIENGHILFNEDERDEILAKRADIRRQREEGESVPPPPKIERGQPLSTMLQQRFAEASGQGHGIRLRGV